MPYANYYPCKIEDCNKQVRGKGMCATHYKRFRIHGDAMKVLPRGNFSKQPVCIMDDCNTKHAALGFCQAHYRAFQTFCDKSRAPERRANLGTSAQRGYVTEYVPDHPFATKQGMVLQHRLVMEQMIGRYLERRENVHHKNGNRKDNRPENLELWNITQPAGQRPEDKVAYALEILELYAPEKLAKELS